MKRILLIEDGRPFWPRIRDLLAKVNATLEERRPGDPPAADSRPKPDLIVIGDAAHEARPPGWWDGALLVLEKGKPPEQVTPIGPGTRQVAASSSIDERAFLALTSRLLGVSERRLFRAEGPGTQVPIEVALKGTPIHRAALQAWRSWLGPVPRTVNAIPWLRDVVPDPGRASGPPRARATP